MLALEQNRKISKFHKRPHIGVPYDVVSQILESPCVLTFFGAIKKSRLMRDFFLKSRKSRSLHFVQALRLGAFHAGREDHHDFFHAGAVHAQNAERVTLNLDFGAR